MIAISQSTSTATSRFYPSSSAGISLVYHGADHLHSKGFTEARSSKGSHYVLFVGDRVGYKNFRALVEATLTPEWPTNLTVRVVGPPFAAEEQAFLQTRNLSNRFENVGRVTDEELATCYNECDCFVFPSKAEGFGMPAIESQLNGTPAVLSDIPVFREICGDSAVYFSPDHPSSLAKAVRAACENRDQLIVRGFENASKYKWSETADKVVQIYEQIAEC